MARAIPFKPDWFVRHDEWKAQMRGRIERALKDGVFRSVNEALEILVRLSRCKDPIACTTDGELYLEVEALVSYGPFDFRIELVVVIEYILEQEPLYEQVKEYFDIENISWELMMHRWRVRSQHPRLWFRRFFGQVIVPGAGALAATTPLDGTGGGPVSPCAPGINGAPSELLVPSVLGRGLCTGNGDPWVACPVAPALHGAASPQPSHLGPKAPVSPT